MTQPGVHYEIDDAEYQRILAEEARLMAAQAEEERDEQLKLSRSLLSFLRGVPARYLPVVAMMLLPKMARADILRFLLHYNRQAATSAAGMRAEINEALRRIRRGVPPVSDDVRATVLSKSAPITVSEPEAPVVEAEDSAAGCCTIAPENDPLPQQESSAMARGGVGALYAAFGGFVMLAGVAHGQIAAAQLIASLAVLTILPFRHHPGALDGALAWQIIVTVLMFVALVGVVAGLLPGLQVSSTLAAMIASLGALGALVLLRR